MNSGDPSLFAQVFTNTWGIVMAVLFFGASIFVHELGHFLAARWRGLKVERFSIGFGPKIIGWKRNGVDYRLSWIPLGGYVALPQLADMSAIEGESESKAEALPPVSYMDKMVTFAAGAFFNIIFALILGTVIWWAGWPTTEWAQSTTVGQVSSTLTMENGEEVVSPAREAGLQPGDKILEVDGKGVDSFSDMVTAIITGDGQNDKGRREAHLLVQRDGQTRKITLHPVLVSTNKRSGDDVRKIGVSPAYSVQVKAVDKNSPAREAGLQQDDIIRQVDGRKVYNANDLTRMLQQSEQDTHTLTIERNGQPLQLTLNPATVKIDKPLLRLEAGEPEADGYALSFVPIRRSDEQPVPTELTDPAQLLVYSYQQDGKGNNPFRFKDTLVSVNGQSIDSLQAMIKTLNVATPPVTAVVERNDQRKDITLQKPLATEIQPANSKELAGISLGSVNMVIHPNPLDQFSQHVETIGSVLGSLLSPKSDVNVGHLAGPITITRVMHNLVIEDIRLILWFTVFLNINLAILNILPIPVLDGGHMLIATINRISRKPLPPKVVMGTQSAFMLLFLGLMAYILFKDSLRWQGDIEADRLYEIRLEQHDLRQVDVTFSNRSEDS